MPSCVQKLFVTADSCMITAACKLTRDVIPEASDAVWEEGWHVASFFLYWEEIALQSILIG